MLIDLYHDTAHGFLRSLLLPRPDLQGMLKGAEFEDHVEEIPETAFAAPFDRRFPVHTPQHAVVSRLYADAQTVPDTVRAKIAEALDAYGVPEELFVAPEEKTASETDDDYLLPEERTYPVRNEPEIKMAEERLLSQATRLPIERRADLFNKLAMAAARHQVTLKPASQAWGATALTNREKLAEALGQRCRFVKSAEARAAYLALAQAAEDNPRALHEHEARVKLASTLLRLDHEEGLVPEYGRRVLDPLQTVFNYPVKLGAHLVSLGRESYDLAALAALPASFYGDALGPEIIGEIAPAGTVNPDALATILPTLPADMLSNLGSALRSAGVAPTGV